MSASTLNKIKQIKSHRQNCIERVNDLRIIANASKDDTNLHSQFKARFIHLDVLYEEFEKLTRDLIPLTITVENYDVVEERIIRTDFYAEYYSVKVVFSELFSSEMKSEGTQLSKNSNVKLPKIELAKFDGDPKYWKTFIDMFNSLVHTNNSLSNIEKFNYLIASLQKQPLALVKCNPLTEANYIVAYESLLKRYENKRLLATSHYLELENAHKIPESGVNSYNLRKLIDTYNENLAALKNLGFEIDKWDFLLFNMMLRRLDSNTVAKFEIEHGSNEIPSFESLNEFVLKQCNALDRVIDCKPRIDTKVKISSQNMSPSHSPPKRYSSSFFAQGKNNLSCTLCKASHLIYKCSQFLALTPKDRYNLVKERKWCMNCLGFKHILKDCTSNSRCFKCGQSHHTLLHFSDATLSPVSQSNPHLQCQISASHISNNLPSNNQSIIHSDPSNKPSTSQIANTTTTLTCSLPSRTTVLL